MKLPRRGVSAGQTVSNQFQGLLSCKDSRTIPQVSAANLNTTALVRAGLPWMKGGAMKEGHPASTIPVFLVRDLSKEVRALQ
jgi:hypothetical protein